MQRGVKAHRRSQRTCKASVFTAGCPVMPATPFTSTSTAVLAPATGQQGWPSNVRLPQTHLESSMRALEQLKESSVNRE